MNGKQNYFPEPLSFQPKTTFNVERQRRILDYYSKPENQRPKKNKAEMFTNDNILGLASVLDISPRKLEFIEEENLAAEFNIFMQTCKRVSLEAIQPLYISEGSFIVLINGTIIKKSESTLSFNISQQFAMPKSTRSFTSLSRYHSFCVPLNYRKAFVKTIQTNPKESPKLIKYDESEVKPFECQTQVVYIEFFDSAFEKLQSWIDVKAKEGLINFVSDCFPEIDDKKALSRLAGKLSRLFIPNRHDIFIEPNKAYLVYKGVIFLKSDLYQMELNRSSLIFQSDVTTPLKVTCISPSAIVISIYLYEISEILEDSKDILNSIVSKLFNNESHRKNMKQVQHIQSQELMEPLFPKETLNLNFFFKGDDAQELKKKNTKWANKLTKASTTTPGLKNVIIRKKKEKSDRKTVELEPEISVFLSNYPYVKLVESEERACSIKKNSSAPKNLEKRHLKLVHTQGNESKVEKDSKKTHYNDKVRKLKIRNIAQKQIPNSKNKDSNLKKAEKQIEEYLLFKQNMIQYPVNGVNDFAIQEVKNHKFMAVLTKMTAGKTLFQNSRKSMKKSHTEEDSTMENFTNQLTQAKSREWEKEKQQENSTYSYCNKVLYPHLPMQKKYRPSNRREAVENSKMTNLSMRFKLKYRKSENEDREIFQQKFRKTENDGWTQRSDQEEGCLKPVSTLFKKSNFMSQKKLKPIL